MAPSTRLAPSHDRRKAVSPASSSSSSSYINPNPRTYINPNPRTKGRITRGRQVFATKITARTIVFPRLLERLGADAARRTVAPCSERTSTVSVTDNGHNDGNDHTDDMTITQHTEDVPAQSYTISRTQPIDFGWIKVSSLVDWLTEARLQKEGSV